MLTAANLQMMASVVMADLVLSMMTVLAEQILPTVEPEKTLNVILTQRRWTTQNVLLHAAIGMLRCHALSVNRKMNLLQRSRTVPCG